MTAENMGATAPSIYLLAIGTISSLISTSVAFVAPFSTSTARAPGIPAVPLQKRTSTVPVPSSSPKHALGCSAPLHSRLPQGRAVTARGSAVAGELSMATPVVGEEEMKQWAEGKFPGCSTVVSTATRLSGLLADVWETLADSSAVVDANSPRVLLFPNCAAVAEPRGLQSLYEHLEVCQDACERFGTAISVSPHPKGGSSGAPAPALVVRIVPGAGGGDNAGYDPDWDDDWDIDRSLLDGIDYDDEDAGAATLEEVDIAALGVVPKGDEEVTELTKSWVQAVITDMGVCPFSVDASRAGLPVGQVRYPVTRETTAEAIYREYWREVELLVSEKDEKSLSTTLLITPEFALHNAEAFEIISQTLTQPLEALHLEDDIQLVFFHPLYTFRDGSDRLGSGGAANFARRSPFPMINILRTKQVRLGQRSIPTGLVYKQNEEVLEEIGAGTLQKMLETRDWAGLAGKKVDRRRVDYYETARKLQGLGVEAPTSPSSTPIQSSSAADPSEEGKTSSDSERTEAHESVPTTAGDVNFQSRVGGGGGGDGEGERPKDGDAGGSGGSSKWTDGGEGFYTGAAADQMATVALAAAASARAQAAATGARYDTPPGWIGMATGADATAEAAAEEVVTASEEAAAASEEAATASEEAAAAGEGTAVAGEAPVDALHARAAPSSEAIAEDDLRIVATALVKRLGSGKPLKPDIFEEFSAAVDRMLADTAAA